MAKKKKALIPGEAPIKNARQELFCVLYAGVASGTYFGNATHCYLHAYGDEKICDEIEAEIERTHSMPGKQGDNKRRELKNRRKRIERNGQSSGARLLSNVIISRRVAYLLDRYLSDDYADREMAYVIGQRGDLMSKVAAYREVAKVKERVRGAGAISGDFTFTWDDDEDPGVKKKSKPKSVRARVSAAAADDEDGMVAQFA